MKMISKLMLLTFMLSLYAYADDSVKKDVKEMSNDTVRGANKVVRETKDKTCEMINGKMECAAKKAKHSIQNGADKVEDAID
jgi:hypothetical protein